MSPFDRVETDRLVLRRPTPADLDELHRIHSDPRTWLHKPELRHDSREESRSQLEVWLAQWRHHGYGYWTVERDGAIVGFGGLMLLARWQGLRDVLNLYYRFDPERWGNGYATETARAALELARRELPELPVIARIRPGNERSIAVAERAGLVRRPAWDDGDFLVYRS